MRAFARGLILTRSPTFSGTPLTTRSHGGIVALPHASRGLTSNEVGDVKDALPAGNARLRMAVLFRISLR